MLRTGESCQMKVNIEQGNAPSGDFDAKWSCTHRLSDPSRRQVWSNGTSALKASLVQRDEFLRDEFGPTG